MLPLHERERRLLPQLAGAPPQIAVQKVAEHAAHVVLAVLVLHHHVRRVLRERLGHHVGALHLAADELVAPPLVPELVRGDEIGRSTSAGFSMRPMKPIAPENGTVLGKDCAKAR